MITIDSFLISWFIVGFLTTIVCVYDDYKQGLLISFIDFFMIFIGTVAGYMTWIICFKAELNYIKQIKYLNELEDECNGY